MASANELSSEATDDSAGTLTSHASTFSAEAVKEKVKVHLLYDSLRPMQIMMLLLVVPACAVTAKHAFSSVSDGDVVVWPAIIIAVAACGAAWMLRYLDARHGPELWLGFLVGTEVFLTGCMLLMHDPVSTLAFYKGRCEDDSLMLFVLINNAVGGIHASLPRSFRYLFTGCVVHHLSVCGTLATTAYVLWDETLPMPVSRLVMHFSMSIGFGFTLVSVLRWNLHLLWRNQMEAERTKTQMLAHLSEEVAHLEAESSSLRLVNESLENARKQSLMRVFMRDLQQSAPCSERAQRLAAAEGRAGQSQVP